MSGYFQRLAQRSGLRASVPNRGGARREPASPASSISLEQEQVVEVTDPGSAVAPAPHEQTPHEATVSKPRTDQHQTTQSQTPIQEWHSESTAAPAALPVTRDAATAPDRGVERTAVAAPDPKVEPKPAAAHPIQSRHAVTPLEHHEQRLVSAGLATAPRAEPIRDQSSRLAVDDTSPRFAQLEHESIEVEARTPSCSQFATGLFARRASAPASTPRAPTAIDVRIGTVAVEIHQAAPPPVLASAPRPAAPRERFSPSRHYIRMD